MIIEKLIKLSENVNKIKNINRGGCCIFASVVSRQLEILNIPHKIIIVNNLGEFLNTKRKTHNLDNWSSSIFQHVLVEFDKVYYDYNGFYDIDVYHTYQRVSNSGTLTLKEAEYFSTKEHIWNKDFDRNQIPYMKKIIQDILNENEKEELDPFPLKLLKKTNKLNKINERTCSISSSNKKKQIIIRHSGKKCLYCPGKYNNFIYEKKQNPICDMCNHKDKYIDIFGFRIFNIFKK